MWTLDGIIDALNAGQLRATYGAVAGVLGVIAIGVMGDRDNCHRNSWIVATDNGLPTGYLEDEMHPNLTRLPIVLATPKRLQRFLDGQGPPR